MNQVMQSEPVRDLIRAIMSLENEQEVEHYLKDICTEEDKLLVLVGSAP